MRLDKFDLNLLVAFDVLLAERSVTKAAQRLNLTQSATSASLKRLRDAFQDELLVLHGKTMVPTPHALALAPEITAAIAMLRMLVSSATGFDPATSDRRFRIAASDYITSVLIAPLGRHLQRVAPYVRLEIALLKEDTSERLSKGEYDLCITPMQFTAPDHPVDMLWEERHVVVGCAHNPLLAKPLTAEEFFRAGHVVVNIDGRKIFIDNVLAERGIFRRVEMDAPSFTQVPWLLPGTMRLALMHERLATMMARGLDLVIAEAPFDIPVMQEIVQYHSTRERDQGLTWLREQFQSVASMIPVRSD